MDNQLTTTFIPKKPLTAPASGGSHAPVSKPVGFLSTISVLLFFITIAIGVGVYFYQSYETSQVATLAASIQTVEKTFEPDLITQLQTLDQQLKNANTVLDNHTTISPIFDMLATSTLKQIRYTKFDVQFDPTNGTTVTMSGDAADYQSIAQESQILGSNTYLQNVLFSNFFLTQQGTVSFDLSFNVKPAFVNFTTAPLTDVNGNPLTASALSTQPAVSANPTETSPSPASAPSATTQ